MEKAKMRARKRIERVSEVLGGTLNQADED